MPRNRDRQHGNVALLACLLILPTIALLGGAIDISNAIQQRIELQKAVDSAVLAASSLTNQRDMEEVATDYLKTNLESSNIDFERLNLAIEAIEDGNGKRVLVEADYSLDTMFLPLLNINSLSINASSGGRQDWQRVEIALVLDVSGSMGGSKISDLRDSGEDFIDTVLTPDVEDLTSISIIPFGTHVRLGSQFNSYRDSSMVDSNKDNDYSDGHRWQGCFALYNQHYTADEWTANSIEPLPEYYHSGLRLCPQSANEAMFQSNDASALVSKMRGLVAESEYAAATSMDEGTLIGVQSLAPHMRGKLGGNFNAERPTDYNSGTLKVLIIMSDGDLTKVDHPLYCWNWYSWSCVGFLENPGAVSGSNYNSKRDAAVSKAEANARQLCGQADKDGVLVFTIGFGIASGSAADQLLSQCASTSANYFRVEDTDIANAFEAIAANINRVRIYM